MARPQVIQQLRHDKFLCQKVFPAFVDSWNYVANRVENIKGDSDIDPQYGQGHITVDNSDPEHPIIRYVNMSDGEESKAVFGDSDLSGVGLSSVHVNDLSGTSYIQLYKFDETPSEVARVTLDNNQGQYDVGSGDWFLVKNGNTLHYKKITIETDLSSGGGGGGHGTCGAFSYDEDTHTIKDGLYLRARQWEAVANAVVATAGYAYLKIGMGTNGTAEVVTGQSSIPATDRYYMYIPLYIFDANLKITNDYRGAPTAQIWEYE